MNPSREGIVTQESQFFGVASHVFVMWWNKRDRARCLLPLFNAAPGAQRNLPLGQPPQPDHPLPSPAVEALLPKPRIHVPIALGAIAPGASGHHVAPAGRPATAHRHDVIEGCPLAQVGIAVGAAPPPGIEDGTPEPLSPLLLADQENAVDPMARNRHRLRPVASGYGAEAGQKPPRGHGHASVRKRETSLPAYCII